MIAFRVLMTLMILGFASRLSAQPTNQTQPEVLVVIGAGGSEEYTNTFVESAEAWKKASQKAGANFTLIGSDSKLGEDSDFELIHHFFGAQLQETQQPLWLILIGHGTFDGKEAKFNLRGPDMTSADLAEWLKPFHRPLAVVDCSSCSAPFLRNLSGTNRVLISATRSGYEQNYTRFGKYFAKAISDPSADLDKDGQISLLESFLMASRNVSEFYASEGRLVTEHAILDDNGDGLGTPADWFRGTRAIKKAKDGAALDGFRASQFHLIPSAAEEKLNVSERTQRDELEASVEKLRSKKSELQEDDYYLQLEHIMIELARLNAQK